MYLTGRNIIRDSSHFQIYEQKNQTFETSQRVDAYASFLSTYGVYKSTKQQNMMKAIQRLRSSALLRLCIVASATIVSVVNAQSNPICYLCGGDPDATFLFPNVIITVPDGSATGGVTSASCAQIFAAGIAQLFTAEECEGAQASTTPNLQTTCGCSNIEGITAAPGGIVTTVPVPVAPVTPPPVTTPTPPPGFVTLPPPVALPVSAPAVLSPVSTPAPILSPTVTPSNFASVVPSDFLSDFPSFITSDAPSDIITDPPVQFETTAPTLTPTSSPSNRPSRNPSSAPTISCPEGKGKMSKGGMMMMGGKKEKGMMGKGMMGKESKKGEEDEDDDEEDDVECPDRSKSSKGMMKEKDTEDKVSKGKGKESKGSKGMGMGEEESKGSGMVEAKDRTEAKEGKKESKRLRYQL
jgi:hypothetical protein